MTPKSDSDEVMRLAEEFLSRCRQGAKPSVDEYAEAHPHLAQRIREVFPAILFAENIGPVWEPSTPQVDGKPKEPHPLFLGDYRIHREIGRGGMGIVYEAVQESLGRHVALKVLPQTSLLSPTFRERFQREARAAARMHHSNIVPVFGVGEQDGTHYYAMQFIAGQGLDQILKEVQRARGHVKTVVPGPKTPHSNVESADAAPSGPKSTSNSQAPSRLSAQSREEYFRGIARIGCQVANALSYAHRQGILHRDIKPSNLLMDAQGTVWVTDFGLAKADDDAELTQTGDYVGTVRYMAPERFRGESTTASDVYSLGVTLYELLTLRPAYLESDRAQLLQQVLSQSPPSLRSLDPRIPRDLETIVSKAMAREVAERYATADDLADELNRFLSDRPIRAQPTPWTERTLRWCRRNPRVAGLLGLVAALLLVILIGSPIMSLKLYEQRQAARTELWNAELARAKSQRLINEPGRRWLSLAALDRARSLLPSLPADPHRVDHLRNEFIACLSLSDLQQQASWPGYPSGSAAICFDSNCERYARGNEQGAISIRRVGDDSEIAALPVAGIGAWGLKFSPDGRFLAVGYHRKNRFNSDQFRVWDWQVGREVLKVDSPTGCGEADFSHDSKIVAFGRDKDQLAIHDLVAEGAPGRTFKTGELPSAIAFHPDGQRIAVASGKLVELRELATGKVLGKRTQNTSVWALAWHPDRERLLMSVGQNIYLLDNIEDNSPTIFRGHEAVIYALAVSHDGQRMASKAQDGTIRYWDLATRQQLMRMPSIYTGCTPMQFSPDDKKLAYASDGQQLWIWQITDGSECRTLAVPGVPTSYQSFGCDFSPDRRIIAVASSHGVHCWNTATGALLGSLPTQSNWGVHFANDGQSLLTTSKSGLQRWPISSPPDATALKFNDPESIGQEGQLMGMDLPRDGNIVVTRRFNGPNIIVRLDQSQPARAIAQHEKANSIAINPDGKQIATGTNFGSDVHIWNADDGQRVTTLACDSSAEVRFSPQGAHLVLSLDKEYRVYDTAKWQLLRTIAKEPETMPAAASFTHDGRLISLRYSPTVVSLADPHSGRRLAVLQAPNQQIILWHQLSADGSMLAAAGHAGIIHLWDLRRIRQQLSQRSLNW